MTLIIKAPGILSAPGGAPVMPAPPNITNGLVWTLNADSLAVADGADVTSWVASGTALAADRTFNNKYPGWNWPSLATTGPGGSKAVYFDGANHERLQNFAFSGADNTVVPVGTVAMVLRVDDWAAGTHNRVMGSESGYTRNLRISGSAPIGMYMEAGATLKNPYQPSGWFVVVAVFDGISSRLSITGAPTVTGATGSASQRGITLGGSITDTPTSAGFTGAIREMRHYNRALTTDDVALLMSTLEDANGI